MLRHVLSYLKGTRAQTSMLLRARVDIETHALIHYSAPFTHRTHCTIPKGTVLLVYDRQPGLFFSCMARDKAGEAALIPAEARQDVKYAGHSFVFGVGEIGRRLETIDTVQSSIDPVSASQTL